MTWALKRQIFYIIIFIVFIGCLSFLIIYPKLNANPTCSDLRQNGSETGVDCGGMCERACLEQMDDLTVVWARSFKVIEGRYNAVAYVTNHNKNAAIKKINYRFRFGDANNVYIGKREGSTFIPPGGNFAVFEPAIDVGNSIPVYTSFEFTETPVWYQVPQEKIEQLKLPISDIVLSNESSAPRLSAKIENNSLFTIPDLSVVAILHEADGNAVGTSRTFVSELKPLGNANLNFTWPEGIKEAVVEKELIPMYDIFSVKLK